MTQSEIVELLNEASRKNCTHERRMAIGQVLARSALSGSIGTNEQKATGVGDMYNFFEYLAMLRPNLLIKNAAYFLFVCRPDPRESVDFALVEKELP